MKLEKAIARTKKRLVDRAKRIGIYENFGQKEVRKLCEKYLKSGVYSDEEDRKKGFINAFNDWSSNYTQ